MKVLLLGVTGNVGSRLLPALIAHKHQIVGYVRSPNKLSAQVKSNLDSIVVGSATDSAAIKAAILIHNCDAVVNAAGVAAKTPFHSAGDFPAIFAAVVKAATEAGRERKAPIRCWLMSGFGILDHPKKPHLFVDYIPLFPTHKPNYQLIKSYAADDLAWSLFCANELIPKYDTPQYPAPADCSANNLVVQADSPPAWSNKFCKIPLIGGYLNVMAQAQEYFAVLENIVDMIAADLEKGLNSEYVGKRVGVKEKSKFQ
ncbi:hypothetical protein TSTA_046100 [Talaromyces stipitatus ATCC 10500]|uniref:NAD(P)-binding domain-containing protein n=1 Tax=Talaromyces stipitatus (strain ATCC 10500 / CBS 375.48 / QM 6759 / NRRL 1006) TaxID=441959 RepID=B8MJF6_TALSN|nr:uncharacterized protein TSTA_046100 [Talaromyces stipitatus ATCC 10500]EED15156.1 hypothetical protein TSTA_046100 [Talaromyces stipitatus ATCC 10500]